MLSVVPVPFADVRATQLTWALGASPEPLAVLRLDGRGVALELRLLGSSHAAALVHDGEEHCEVVACATKGGAAGQSLPEDVEVALPGLQYVFRSRTSAPATGVTPLAAALRTRFAGDSTALVGTFPGHADALTVLAAESPLAWRTWHLYPNTGEVVRTRTDVTPVAR